MFRSFHEKGDISKLVKFGVELNLTSVCCDLCLFILRQMKEQE